MNHREQIVEAVKIALLQNDPQHIQNVAEIATAVVLSFPLDQIHYAKDDKPQPRIREVSSVERYDNYKGRNGR